MALDPDTLAQFLETIRRFVRERLVPAEEGVAESDRVPPGIIAEMRQLGLFGMTIPERHGGLGLSMSEEVQVLFELCRTSPAFRSVHGTNNGIGSQGIVIDGSEEQKKKYLPDVAKGKRLAAFGLTEANAGSDAAGIRTEARKVGDDYVLNGTKQWITNGGEAEVYSVIAMTDRGKGGRGATAFIVEKGMEGFSFGKKEKKLGIRASATRELVFQDCKVPRENVIGREGMGFILAMRTFDRTRPGIGAQGVGVAQGALEAAVAYAKEREQFDKKIISFQAVQHMLADMAIQVEAARALVYAVARYIDSSPRDFSKASAISKVFPSDTAMKVTVDALQIFGGYGYMREYPIEKMVRDAKILQIYEGTNQIQRNMIALELIKEAASSKKRQQ